MRGNEEWWDRIARTEPVDSLKDIIHTGTASGKPFTPYIPLCRLPPLNSVLDFGCGLGRNFAYLKSVAMHVTGHDLSAMIDRCRAVSTTQVDELTADWHALAQRRFDLIFSQLVLQHIDPESVSNRLRDFAKMAPLFYLLTRAENDFGPRVLEIVADLKLFEPIECREVDHDQTSHQLKNLGDLPFSEAIQRQTGHFELLFQVPG